MSSVQYLLKKNFYTLIVFIIHTSAFAGKLSGIITDSNNNPISFASVLVKGTLKGTTANNKGEYTLQLNEGSYILMVQHIGFKTIEKSVTIGKEDLVLNFIMQEQSYDLKAVTIKQGEDPAYEIIRNAIKKRPVYEEENRKFTTEVYIKGQMKLRNFPDKFFGAKVDFEDGDTSKRKMIFLSESVAKYSVDNKKRKIEVISTKLSGQSDGFGFSSPQIFSFYQNNIRLGNLNPRGFISPISSNALSFYKFKFEGSFFENNKMVNRIKVIPRRLYEPLFNGYINIIEDEWRIHSVQAVLYKQNQMQFVDTLFIEQLYVPTGNTWIIKQQTIRPAVKFFGFDAIGHFVQVYDKFDLNPQFTKGFFDNTLLKFEDSSNKRQLAYWDSIRPIPLLAEEAVDYKKKDSLEKVRKDPAYLDSLDKKKNRLNVVGLILSGQSFTKRKLKTTYQLSPLLDDINYNTVEGWVVQLSGQYEKRFSETRRERLTIEPTVRYGFSNKHLNPWLAVNYYYGKKYYSSMNVSFGKRIFQFDNNSPVRPSFNTFSTLYYEHNYLKIYEANFLRATYNKELGKGFLVTGDIQYQDRHNLENTSLIKWKDYSDRSFTSNFSIPNHQSLAASINIRWQPGSRYIELPDRKFSIGSKYPTFNFLYSQGIKNVAGSDVDYNKWRFSMSDNLNLKLYGSLDYRLGAGGFINTKSLYFPDYRHYIGNNFTLVSQYLQGYQLLPFYSYSNIEKFYATAFVEYHLNGLLTNKIPLFKKLNWFLVTSSNALYLKSGVWYSEVFIGIENILKVFRLDYLRSFAGDSNHGLSGFRLSIPLFLNKVVND